jgi:hypothetical protein
MLVLKATTRQKNKLEGIYKNGAYLQFIKDANNNWVVNDAVLFDNNFLDIKNELEKLPLIEFIPKEISI